MNPIEIHRKASSVGGGGGGGGGGPTISIPAGSYVNSAVDPADAFCAVDFRSDGSVQVSAGTSPSSPADWRTGGGAGADYEITFNNGSSWLSLGSNQITSVSRTVAGTTNASRITKIRLAAGGAIKATGTLNLEATVEI